MLENILTKALLTLIMRELGLDAANLKQMGTEYAKKYVAELLENQFGGRARQRVIRTLTRLKKGPGTTDDTKKEFVRAILYRLWAQITRSGTVADHFRDAFDDAVVAIVVPELTQETTIEAAVDMVIRAQVAIIWDKALDQIN